MINYLFESSVCVALLYLLYLLLLRRDIHFNAKRFYLMSSLIFSMIIPLLHFTYTSGPSSYIFESAENEVISAISAPGQESNWSLTTILTWIYLSGVLIVGTKFALSLSKIYKTIKAHNVISEENYHMVEVENELPISSFFNYIFINNTDKQTDEFAPMLAHELKHMKDWHSLDVVLLELAKIFYWFNPFIYLINNSLRAQHEFVCDREVVRNSSAKTYERVLIKNLFKQVDQSLLSPFNQLPIKTRITMIYKKTPSRLSFIKFVATIPLLAFLIFTFSCEESGGTDAELESSLGMTKTISGKVYSAENGKALPGVNIVVKGARLGTVTNISGEYRLEVPNNYNELEFAFIGLQSQTMNIGEREVIDVELAKDNSGEWDDIIN
ncbi:MAG: carboxypeptidase-like regulatory domain-containing protein [Bacteroidota bacterium]